MINTKNKNKEIESKLKELKDLSMVYNPNPLVQKQYEENYYKKLKKYDHERWRREKGLVYIKNPKEQSPLLVYKHSLPSSSMHKLDERKLLFKDSDKIKGPQKTTTDIYREELGNGKWIEPLGVTAFASALAAASNFPPIVPVVPAIFGIGSRKISKFTQKKSGEKAYHRRQAEKDILRARTRESSKKKRKYIDKLERRLEKGSKSFSKSEKKKYSTALSKLQLDFYMKDITYKSKERHVLLEKICKKWIEHYFPGNPNWFEDLKEIGREFIYFGRMKQVGDKVTVKIKNNPDIKGQILQINDNTVQIRKDGVIPLETVKKWQLDLPSSHIGNCSERKDNDGCELCDPKIGMGLHWYQFSQQVKVDIERGNTALSESLPDFGPNGPGPVFTYKPLFDDTGISFLNDEKKKIGTNEEIIANISAAFAALYFDNRFCNIPFFFEYGQDHPIWYSFLWVLMNGNESHAFVLFIILLTKFYPNFSVFPKGTGP